MCVSVILSLNFLFQFLRLLRVQIPPKRKEGNFCSTPSCTQHEISHFAWIDFLQLCHVVLELALDTHSFIHSIILIIIRFERGRRYRVCVFHFLFFFLRFIYFFHAAFPFPLTLWRHRLNKTQRLKNCLGLCATSLIDLGGDNNK